MSEGVWAVIARAKGPRRVELSARCADGRAWKREVAFEASNSTAEVAVLGLAHALRRLRDEEATSVRVGVTEPTLHGYLTRGWQPRSVAMVRALRTLIDAADGLELSFVELPRPKRAQDAPTRKSRTRHRPAQPSGAPP
jgi:hypothetical protein